MKVCDIRKMLLRYAGLFLASFLSFIGAFVVTQGENYADAALRFIRKPIYNEVNISKLNRQKAISDSLFKMYMISNDSQYRGIIAEIRQLREVEIRQLQDSYILLDGKLDKVSAETKGFMDALSLFSRISLTTAPDTGCYRIRQDTVLPAASNVSLAH
jgi:hypothetical protein